MTDHLKKIDKGFSSIYGHYEDIEENGIVVKDMRRRVYSHVNKYLIKTDDILEINAGSGIDAFHFAQQGNNIHATDIAEGFLDYFNKKTQEFDIGDRVTFEKLSFFDLDKIKNRRFNYIFSNFGGLNCTNNLANVFQQFNGMLKENGKITLVIMPKICPWEWLWFLKDRKAAFRRFSKKSVSAKIEDEIVETWYHPSSKVYQLLKKNFRLLKIENLALFSPSGVNDDFAIKYPKIYKFLTIIDKEMQFIQPKGMGDYYIMTLQKK